MKGRRRREESGEGWVDGEIVNDMTVVLYSS